MQHQLAHCPDTAIVATGVVATAAANLMLEPSSEDLRLFLLPLIGSMVLTGGVIMLNPNPDTRRITIGRGMVALFFGVLGPQVLAEFHPTLASVAVKPVFLFLLGGLVSGLTYILSKPLTAHLYKRADGASKLLVDKLETYVPKPPKEPES
jgi:hypothetical protein